MLREQHLAPKRVLSLLPIFFVLALIGVYRSAPHSVAGVALASLKAASSDDFVWQSTEIVFDGAQLCGYQQEPDIALDAADNAYAVWMDCRNLAGNGNWDIYFAYRPAGGVWGPNVKVNDDTGAARQSQPAIAVDAAGNAYAVWTDERNGTADIYYSRRPAGGKWSANVKVNDDANDALQGHPRIGVDAAGTVFVVFEDQRNGDNDIYLAFQSSARTWSTNTRLNNDRDRESTAQYEPDIAVTTTGKYCAVWRENYQPDGPDIMLYCSLSQGGQPQPQIVNEVVLQPTERSLPAVGVDQDGKAFVAWVNGQGSPPQRNIYFAYYDNNQWQRGQVNSDPDTSYTPDFDLAVDTAGNASVAWIRYIFAANQKCFGLCFAYRPAGGVWGANSTIVERVNSPAQPTIAVNGNHNLVGIWQDFRNRDYDIYSMARPSGGDWTSSSKVNDDLDSGWQSRPDIAVDSTGVVYAVWEDARGGSTGDRSDIYAARRPAAAPWDTFARVNTDALGPSNEQRHPAVALDTNRGAFAVWQDGSSGPDIYFAHRPPNGEWGSHVKISDDMTGAGQYVPDIAIDSAGNGYAIWEDRRNDSGDIYFAYRPAGGSWGVNVKVNDDQGSAGQSWPAIAVDTSGNAYAVWEDGRNGDNDVFFAYRPDGGEWQANIQVNDANSSYQGSSDIAVSPDGQAVAIWRDNRNNTWDTYAAYRPKDGVWGSNAKISGGENTQDPKIAMDYLGNAYAIWSASSVTNAGIRFAYRPAGSVWGGSVPVVSSSVYSAGRSAIAVDGAGLPYVIWEDSRQNTPHLYFAYATRSGLPGPVYLPLLVR